MRLHLFTLPWYNMVQVDPDLRFLPKVKNLFDNKTSERLKELGIV